MTRSFVAEIIGPAGSGKTTLTQLLRTRNNVRAGLSVWRLPLSLLLFSACSSLPALVGLCVHRTLAWDELKLVIQHNALIRLLRVEKTKGRAAVLLDEGNVFALAKLGAFGRNGSVENGGEPWMQNLLNNVAPELDAVIWLDAPDNVLAKRIRERDKDHRMKHKSDAEIEQHLSLYRSSFEHVVGELRKRNGHSLKVFRFSTDRLAMEQIASRVLAHARVRA